jgi:hypothetical protein
MESKKIQNLQVRLNSLKTQSDDFLTWYLNQTIKDPVFCQDEEKILLPYEGKDVEFIMKLFKIYLNEFYPDYELNSKDLPIIQYLVDIVAGIVPKKGLIIRGTIGSGKTLLMFLWLHFRQNILNNDVPNSYWPDEKGKAKYSILTPEKIIREFKEREYQFINQDHGNILFLDDIGELAEINNFGTQINLLSEIILNRYNKFKLNPDLEIYATTNLTSKQLTEVIGERAFSRLMEMAEWNIGLIVGNDRRMCGNIVKKWPEIVWKDYRKLDI